MESSSLDDDLWRVILSKLAIPELSRAACVCRSWRRFAGDPAALASAFKSSWKLRDVRGAPSTPTFWRAPGLNCFAISHTVGRLDSLPALAVRYNVQVSEIRRMNNMLSDHGICARDRLLIPVTRPEQVRGEICYIEMDFHSRREAAVIYPDGYGGPAELQLSSKAQSHRAVCSLKRSVFDYLRRGLNLDSETARYYLSLTGGDFRRAMEELKQDLGWEENNMSLGW